MKNLPIMSVSGIRGKIRETLSPYFYSVIAYLHTKYAQGGKIVVGRDTRPSGEEFAKAVFRGIRCAGGIPVDIGIAPTPTTCFATNYFDAKAGIIITASHNPEPYNGYKMAHSSGRLFFQDECVKIYQSYRTANYPSEEEIIKYPDNPEYSSDAINPHIESIISAVDVDLIKNAGIKVAVDSINGAASIIFPKLLEKLSVKWNGVHNKLDGDFIHNPEPRPVNLTDLAALLHSNEDFWGGFAFDPDGDRLATMGEHGEPVSEENTIVLALENVLKDNITDVAVNLSTTMLIDDIARKHGIKVIRTKIGEANVVEVMKKNGCIIGGEGNGGVIYPRVSTVRDGLIGMALIIELMAKTGKRLSELISELPVYPIVKQKIPLRNKNGIDIINRLTSIFTDETIDTQDGLKIIRDYGWVHIRLSNTEPIIRCYAEAKTEKQAKALIDMIISKM